MRSLYSKDEMLIAVAKKKPRLQALVDNIANMSSDDIAALSEPLWVKEALSTLKSTNGLGQKARINQILERSETLAAEARVLPTPTYEVRLWDGSSEFVGTSMEVHHHGWQIQVDNGDTFMIMDDDLVRFGDSVIRVDEWNRYPLMLNSRFIGYMTLENYKGFHKALLNQRHQL
jgi:hypothetical protein